MINIISGDITSQELISVVTCYVFQDLTLVLPLKFYEGFNVRDPVFKFISENMLDNFKEFNI